MSFTGQYLGLQILEKLIQTRWKALPDAQRQGKDTFMYNVCIAIMTIFRNTALYRWLDHDGCFRRSQNAQGKDFHEQVESDSRAGLFKFIQT